VTPAAYIAAKPPFSYIILLAKMLRGYRKFNACRRLNKAFYVVSIPRLCRYDACPIRPFSSKATIYDIDRPRTTKQPASASNTSTIIYRRHVATENRGLRAATAACFLNTSYWCWYTCRTVLGEALAPLPYYLDPDAAMVGMGTAVLVSYACYSYSTSVLISKLSYNATRRKVKVWFHQFPTGREASSFVEYDWGDIYLDQSRAEVKQLVEKLGGDTTKFKGYLPLRTLDDRGKTKDWSILLHLKEPLTIKNNDLFLQALLLDHPPEADDDEMAFGEDAERKAEKEERSPGRGYRRGIKPRRIRK
jgi:hypothetical protein